ncbi:MAG: hypothetical protein L0Y71_07280 [Gemmataceae bacterium]|nr:hypothetical protein [Gemmataceae bacterium]
MSTTPLVANPAQTQVEEVLQRLAAQVRASVPGVQCRIHHGSNDAFAWWVVARFSNPKDEHQVDVSVECRTNGPQCLIAADVAREDGTVLHELTKSVESDACGSELHGSTAAFLFEQVGCIIAELH